MKLHNPLKTEYLPEHMTESQRKHYRWLGTTAVIGLPLAFGTTLCTPLFRWLIDQPLNQKTLDGVGAFFARVAGGDIFSMNYAFVVSPNYGGFDALKAYLGVAFVSTVVYMAPALLNPYLRQVMKGGFADWCDDETLEEMETREQVGIKGGHLMALGRWPKGKRKGQMVMMIETLSALCLAPPGTGKCLGPDELILMADGTVKRNRELVVGDHVMGPDGTPRRVLSTNWGYGPMYEVIPNKGRSWTCNGDHILSLRCSKKPRHRSIAPKQGEVRHFTVEEWLALSQEQKGKWKQWRAAIDFAEQPDPEVDPYLIGLILGDGSTVKRVGIHTADPEIVEYLAEQAAVHGLEVRRRLQPQEQNASAYYALTARNGGNPYIKNPVCNAVRKYGLHVTCADKFIPHELKVGSRETRLRILAGIINSDGSYDPKGKGYELISSSKRLIEDVAFVARSLGLAAYPKECRKTCTNNGVIGTYHRLFISGDVSIIPVQLFRRFPLPRRMNKDVSNTGFKIRPIGNGPWFGITLDGDRQFLLDDFTVTHNTAAFVVPTLLKGDNVSFIVNDPKPELYEMTGHYRSKVSHVFMLNWAKVDEPNYIFTFDFSKPSPFRKVFLELYGKGIKGLIPEELVAGYKARDAAGRDDGTFDVPIAPARFELVKKWVNERDGAGVYTVRDPVFYPRFNFLSPKLVPPQGPDRDTYLDTVAKTLIPNPDGGKGNDYFVTKGRAALTGFMHYLITKVGDKKDYNGLPAEWTGYEPSIPMLSDWLAVSQFESTKKTGDEDPMAAMGVDKMGEWIRTLCDDVKPGGKFPSPRAFVELSSLVNMADKERSGVFGTMDQALLPFKNAAVAQRTSACDFTPDDMRGMKAPGSDEVKPVTLYICVNQAEAGAFETVTALLYEVFSQSLISYGPGELNPKTGRELGPFPVCFALDEFAKLPRIESVITGPDLGRAKKVSYLLAAQDFGQIRKKYTAEDESVIITTTAVKYVLAQNNTDTIEKFKKMAGETTIQRAQKTYNEGLSKSANPMAWSRSEQIENISFLRNEDVASLKPGKNIVLVQNFLHRPMKLDTPYFFKDKDMVQHVRSRGKGPIATQTVPAFIFKSRLETVDPAEAAKRRGGRQRKQRDDEATKHLTREVVAYQG
jgi:hypothetical protein